MWPPGTQLLYKGPWEGMPLEIVAQGFRQIKSTWQFGKMFGYLGPHLLAGLAHLPFVYKEPPEIQAVR